MTPAYEFGYVLGYYGIGMIIAFCVVQFVLKPKYFNKYQKDMNYLIYLIWLFIIFMLVTFLLFLIE
ncbi:hypothetical protein [Isobaculum melis]|uniref:Uncharacterized protein n=1 Tax=Isobaculum melis TaxID=142588 RepID=A0A1H9TW21_9LACT|nr:hypothetical protein [Isobaculum melis]SES01326.1 hypothetical protein SAMN04488559_11718 [Isobaculum melis]